MYCPQCGSPNVKVEQRNGNENKLSFLQKLQGNKSSGKTFAVCEDCGYSWDLDEFQEQQISRETDAQTDIGQNNQGESKQGKTDLNFFDKLRNKRKTDTEKDDQKENDAGQDKTNLHIFNRHQNNNEDDTEEKGQEEGNTNKGGKARKTAIIGGVTVAAIGIIILLVMNVAHVGQAQVPDSASALKGENYEEVTNEFKEAGFNSIHTNIINESIEESLDKEGEVENVSVDEDDKFNSGSWFSDDAEVVITYHPEIKKAQVTFSAASLKGENYEEVISKFEDAGFTNIQTDTIDDVITGSTNEEGEVETVSAFGDDNFDAGAEFPVEGEILITYHAFLEAQVPDSASSLKGENYEEVVKDFEDAGFTNIKTEILEDLIVGWLTEDGEVESVSIDGDDDFGSDASFRVDAEVIVTYHTFAEREEEEEEDDSEDSDKKEEEDTLKGLNGQTLDKAKKKIEDLGYTATYYHANTGMDFTTNFDFMGDLSDWVVTDIKNVNTSKKTLDVYINTAENIQADSAKDDMTSKLEEKLDSISAWIAAEDYGKKQYPYGFKLHYAIGKLAEEAEDEDTWYLKATCSVTNAFNATADYNCEARVTGTTENPKVIEFNVY